MVFNGVDNVEIINVHPMNDLNETHYISMVKKANEPVFYVTCCCNSDWYYEFYLENNSDYERVKFNVMEAIFECDTMEELLCYLSEVFEDGFSDILVEDVAELQTGEIECDQDCANCEFC